MLAEGGFPGEGQEYGATGRPYHSGPQPKPGDWYCPSCGDLQFFRNAACRKCGTPNPSGSGLAGGGGYPAAKVAPGDWYCPSCNDLNFARNAACRKCGVPNPAGDAGHYSSQKPMRSGDWMCPTCNDHNYARNQTCRKCGEPCPEGCGYQQLPGDWTCPQCGDYQFAKNQVCRRCQTPNPNPDPEQQALASQEKPQKPGDWHCPSCGDLQFARNSVCRRCGTPSPNPVAYGGPAPKPGDWYCPNCNDLQFARNSHCKRCGTNNPNPTSPDGTSFHMKPGDWLCPTCGDLQFATRSQCRKCGTGPGPTAHSMAAAPVQGYASGGFGNFSHKPVKPGDWYCPSCGDHQYARNTQCRRCGTPNPTPGGDMGYSGKGMMVDHQKGKAAGGKGAFGDQAGKPTSWKCPNCNELVFARNSECKSCGTPRPESAESGGVGGVRSAPY